MTKLENLFDPEVVSAFMEAKLDSYMMMLPFVKIDNTLVGQPGSKITTLKWDYIGDAEVVAEGEAMPQRSLSYTSEETTIKKYANSVPLTDEAVLSGAGDPEGEAVRQLTISIASALDKDAIAIAQGAKTKITMTTPIGYEGLVNIQDYFNEEVMTEKVILISPKQVTSLRKDPDFTSKEKYDSNVVATGEIGMIAGLRVVPSKRIVAVGGKYLNPVLKLSNQDIDDDTYPIKLNLKRDTMPEKSRDADRGVTTAHVNKHCAIHIEDESKIVVAVFPEVVHDYTVTVATIDETKGDAVATIDDATKTTKTK